MDEKGDQRRFLYYFIVLFVVLACSIGAVGFFYYEKQARHIKEEKQSELSAIADLKVREIRNWRGERMADAEVLYDNGIFSGLLRQWLGNPASPDLKEEIKGWLTSVRERYDYDSIVLVDAAGELRLSVPDGAHPEHAGRDMLDEAARAGRPFFHDLHRSPALGLIHLCVVVPFFSPLHDRSPIGVLVLRIDPYRFLYPLVQSWPTRSDSAETLLVKRDGDEVIFLNELRFRKNTALSMRLPANDLQLPAAAAVLGREGPFEGVDYRGVEVLACCKAVPGSPWFMVAKVDREEIYSPLRSRARSTWLLVILMVGAAGAAIGFVWSRQNGEFYRRQYESELERLKLAERYEHLMECANDIIVLYDGSGRITKVNARAVASYGYMEEEMIGMHLIDLRNPEAQSPFDEHRQELDRRKGFVFETIHRRKDGSSFPVEVSATAVPMGEETAYLAIARDVSERKQAEARIRRLNRLYSCLSEINQAVVRVRDRNRLFQEACRIAVEYGQFGIAWIGLVDGETSMVRVAAHCGGDEKYFDGLQFSLDDSLETHGSMGRAMNNGSSAVSNMIGQEPDGALWREMAFKLGFRSSAAVPLRVDGEMVAGFECYAVEPDFFDPEEIRLIEEIGVDISFGMEMIRQEAQKELAEAKLKESEAAYRTIFENTGAATVILDGDATVSLANRKFEELTGCAREDLAGVKRLFEFVAASDVAMVRERHLLRRSNLALAPTEYEFRIVDKSGNIKDVYTSIAMIPGTSKSVASLLDITQKKATENALKESEAKYRELVENASSIILRLDTEGRIVFFNRYAQQFFGYGEGEILGRHFVGAIVPERDLPGSDPAPAAENVLDRLERHLGNESESIRRNGDRAWIAWTSKAVFDSDGQFRGLLCIGNDVTEQKLLGEQYRQSQKMEAVGRLAGGIAHDFNNLLGIMTGYSEVALLGLNSDDPLRESIEHIRSAGSRAANLTRQLLAFSRKQILEPRVVNLNAVVSETEKMLRRLIGEDIDLVAVLDSNLEAIRIDPGQIEQVIMNLAVNARDAMPEGGRLTIETANVELDESYTREHLSVERGSYVMLAVSDTGMGMDHETQSQIFEPFFTTKERDKGTGLGLSTVYGIVKQSMGSIYVYSEPGRGTTFKIYFPRIDSGMEPAVPGQVSLPNLRGSETVLVVEDETTLREMIREVLSRFGYRVLGAGHAGDALEIAGKHDGTIHLMVTDVVMPGMSGRRLSEILERSRPEMKTLFISGYTDNAIVHHGVLDPGVSFLQKPFTIDRLLRRVRKILNGSE